MNNKALLTIIICTYNQKDTIARCIESAASQICEYPYEIHICDDASTDGTADICREYALKYPDKVKAFLQEKNTFSDKNLKSHIVTEYERLNTKYFCYIEGDDYYYDNSFIQSGIKFLESNDEYYIYGCNTLFQNLLTNKEHKLNTYTGFSTNTIEDLYTNKMNFTATQSRIYRNTQTKVPYEDTKMFLYHISFGPSYFDDKVAGVYCYTGEGIWSSLSVGYQKKINLMVPYRMCQILNFKYEYVWIRMLSSTNRIIIKFLKFFFGMKLGWEIWFTLNFVPSFGLCVLDKNWQFPIKKVNKEKLIKVQKKIQKRNKEKLKFGLKILTFIEENKLYITPKIHEIIQKSIIRKRKRLENLNSTNL